jgi:hypothetical protein
MDLKGINIFSGERGLGGALTNPTLLSRTKGSIKGLYGIEYGGVRYSDVEGAYHRLKGDSAPDNDELMANLIAAKFLQHRTLFDEVTERGGVQFLELCDHFTGAKSASAQSWEGAGRNSRFIRNLITGFELAFSGGFSVNKQSALF